MPQKKKRQISETYPQFLEKERTKAEACHLFEDKVISFCFWCMFALCLYVCVRYGALYWFHTVGLSASLHDFLNEFFFF